MWCVVPGCSGVGIGVIMMRSSRPHDPPRIAIGQRAQRVYGTQTVHCTHPWYLLAKVRPYCNLLRNHSTLRWGMLYTAAEGASDPHPLYVSGTSCNHLLLLHLWRPTFVAPNICGADSGLE